MPPRLASFVSYSLAVHSFRAAGLALSLASTCVSALSLAQETTTSSGPIAPLWEARYGKLLAAQERSIAVRTHGTRVFDLALSTSAGLEPELVVTAWDPAASQVLWQRHMSGPTFSFSSPIGDLEVSPDGARVYVASSRDANLPAAFVGVLDASSGALLAIWQHTTPLTGFQRARLAPDGGTLYATGVSPVFSGDDVVCAFSTSSGQLLWSQPVVLGINSITPSLEVAPDGARVYVGGEHGLEARVAASGALVWAEPGPTYDIALLPSFGLVAQANLGNVILHAAATGAVVTSVQLPNKIARTVAFDPSSSDWIVATRSISNGTTALARYDVQGTQLWQKPLAQTWTPRELAWTPASGSVPARAWLCGVQAVSGAFLSVLDPQSGTTIATQTSLGVGGPAGAEPELALGPQAGEVAYARALPTNAMDVRVDVIGANGASSGGFDLALSADAAEELLGAAAVANGGALVFASTATAGLARTLARRVDAASGALQWETELGYLSATSASAPIALPATTRRFACTSDGARALVAGWHGNAAAISAFDTSSGAVAWNLSLASGLSVHDLEVLAGDARAVVVADSHDTVRTYGLQLAGSTDWNALEGSTPPYYDATPRVVGSPDGTRVVVAFTVQALVDLDLRVRMRDAVHGNLIWSVDVDHGPATSGGNAQELTALAASPDGLRYFAAARLSASAFVQSALYALDAASGNVLWESVFDATSQSYFALALRPDGSELALAARPTLTSSLAPVRVFDALSGTLRWTRNLPLPELGCLRARYDASGAKLYVGQCAQSFWLPGMSAGGHGALAFAATDGAPVWSYEIDSTDAFPETVNALVETDAPRRLFVLGTNAINGLASDVFVRALDLPELTQNTAQLSVASGGAVEFELDAGPQLGGALAWLAGSASGTQPGLALDGVLLPLVPDAYFDYFISAPNQGYLHGTLGVLDAFGQRGASIALPAGSDPALAGLVLHHAYVAIDVTVPAVKLASNALALALVP